MASSEKQSRGGFKLEPRIYRLQFDDHDLLKGATVKCRGVSLARVVEIIKLLGLIVQSDGGLGGMSTDDVEEINRLWELLSDVIVEWDLEDDDGPVPISVDGLSRLDVEISMVLTMNWLKAVLAISDPLSLSSTGKSSTVEQLIPMETLSATPAT